MRKLQTGIILRTKADLDDGFQLSEDIRSKSQVLRNHLFLDTIYFRIASYYFRGYQRNCATS